MRSLDYNGERVSQAPARMIASANLPSRFGRFRMAIMKDPFGGPDVAVLRRGAVRSTSPPLVRLHSECLTGDTFGSLRCDCGE